MLTTETVETIFDPLICQLLQVCPSRRGRGCFETESFLFHRQREHTGPQQLFCLRELALTCLLCRLHTLWLHFLDQLLLLKHQQGASRALLGFKMVQTHFILLSWLVIKHQQQSRMKIFSNNTPLVQNCQDSFLVLPNGWTKIKDDKSPKVMPALPLPNLLRHIATKAWLLVIFQKRWLLHPMDDRQRPKHQIIFRSSTMPSLPSATSLRSRAMSVVAKNYELLCYGCKARHQMNRFTNKP